MRDTTNEAIDHEAIRALFATAPTPDQHLDAARDFHRIALRRVAEARQFELWPTYAYKGAPLRDDALDDHLAATDTLCAAVGELLGIVREQSGQIAGLLELIEARDAQAGAAA